MAAFRYFPFLTVFTFQPAAGACDADGRQQNGFSTRFPMLNGRSLFSDEPPEVEAQRRRRGSGSGPTERADMPGRPSQQGGSDRTPPGGGGQSPFSGGRIPGGRKGGLSCGTIVILLLVYLAFQLFSGGGTGSQEQSPTQEDVSQSIATSEPVGPVLGTPAAAPTSRPQKPAASAGGGAASGQTWTVLLYQDADDPTLEQDIYMDLNEAERVGSSQQVNIVAQIDRYAGAFQGDGDWTSTRRYYLTQDDDLNRIHSQMVADIGEVSMADPKTLVDFVTWGMKTYPADKYVLILSDHGMGWPGGFTDPKPGGLRAVSAPFAQVMDENMMYTNDIDQALGQIRQQTGLDRFELIGLDACLMAHLEVLSALAPHTRFVVSSQETEPALGWAYTSFLQALEDNPGMNGGELGKYIVSSYIDKDERIVDDQARADFLRQGSPYGGLFGSPRDVDPRQLSNQLGKSVTLTAADMDAVPGLMDSVNRLAFVLQKDNQSVVAQVRTYAQSYTSIFGEKVPPSYIDLGNFAQMLQKESSSNAVRTAAGAVLDRLKQVVIAEKHGSEKPGSKGVSIYFPNSQLYRSVAAGPRSYTLIADRFAKDSLWDDFLAFHYTKVPFKVETGKAVVPGSTTRVVAPGSGKFEVSALTLSQSETNYDQPVTLRAELSGSNIGYVYLFVGYFDPASKSILVADKDYLESPQSRQIGDLYYPNWSDSQTFKLKFDWLPTVFAINDGNQSVVALLKPERYGASAEEAVYTADGIYLSKESGESRTARLYFSGGKLQRVFGFTGSDETGAPHEIIPQTGDQVTLLQTWLEQDSSGGYQQVTEKGKTLTFGSQMFVWKEQYAAAGQYVVGFVVTDLDGVEQQSLGTLRVR
jgi:hypothetical protein